jgi:hypothetical protein
LLFIALEILFTDDALIANELDKAVDAKELLIANELLIALDELIANDAVPNKDPVNAVEVTDVNPASVVAVPPKLIPVLPTVIELFARFAFVIPAVPLKLALVNPEIDPPKVIVPVLVIVPPVKVMPETVPAVATEVTPLFTTLVAHEAVPNRDPVYPPVELTLPVTVNDPVIIAEPVNGNADVAEPVATVIGNVVPFPFVNVIVFDDTEAVIILFPTKEAVEAKELLIEVVANELDNADVANDALIDDDANDAVPINDPENVALVSVFVVALNVNAVESTRTALFPVVPSVNAI